MRTVPTRPYPRAKRKGGFSLLELLLVLSLAPVVFFAVYSNFSAGVRLWQRLQIESPEESLVIFSQKARRDFENMMRYSPISFEGAKDEAVFPAGIVSETALGGRHSIGKTRYFYNKSAKAIFRETQNLSQVYRDSSGTVTLLLKNVSSFEMAYLTFDKLGNAFVWNDAYQPEKAGSLPLAVRLSYSLAGMDEGTEQVFFIPAGGPSS